MRESMVYNARLHGADAVLLVSANSKKELYPIQVPPRYNWVPISGPVIINKKNNTYCYAGPSYIPIFEPGYTRWWTNVIIGIDAEMIVFKK